jgi:hypothetical protein
MKDPITLLLRLFGYEIRKPSLLFMSMWETTNLGWTGRMTLNNKIKQYQYRLHE